MGENVKNIVQAAHHHLDDIEALIKRAELGENIPRSWVDEIADKTNALIESLPKDKANNIIERLENIAKVLDFKYKGIPINDAIKNKALHSYNSNPVIPSDWGIDPDAPLNIELTDKGKRDLEILGVNFKNKNYHKATFKDSVDAQLPIPMGQKSDIVKELDRQGLVQGTPEFKKAISELVKTSFISISASKFFQQHRDFDPKLWDLFCPRIYKGVDSFHDPRYVTAFNVGAVGIYRSLKAEDINTEDGNSIAIKAMWSCLMYKHDNPIFFVSKSLMEAALQTEPPETVGWRDIKLPYEAAAFVLPLNSFKAPMGGDIGFLAYSRFTENQVLKIPIYEDRLGAEKDSFEILGFDVTHLVDFHRLFVEQEYIPGQAFAESNTSALSIVDKRIIDFKEGISDEEYKAFHENMAKLIFNLLLLMEHHPEVVNSQASTMVGRHKKSRTELWSPNVIGRNYSTHRISGGGSHASPRWHWRRGHWRTQNKGKMICKNCSLPPAWHDAEGASKAHKFLGICVKAKYRYEEQIRKWIKPIMVNYKEETNA